jgi:G3E family GTPase
MVMLTGFLGSGKTTFLRELLECLPAQKLTANVILNDYENAELDAETIQEKAATIAPLSASCACCGGLEDLVNFALAAQSTTDDVLLVELNGTADPIPLLETFTLLESKLRFRPRWQVAIIDACQFGHRGEFHELEVQQITTASHFFISHTETASSSRHNEVLEQVKRINPHASQTTPLRIAKHLAEIIADAQPSIICASSAAEAKPKRRSHGHRLSHAFTGCQILLPPIVHHQQIISWLRALPDSVIRAKALVTTFEIDHCRHLFERVGTDRFPDPISLPISDRVPPSTICIGPNLHPQQLLKLASTHFGSLVSIP